MLYDYVLKEIKSLHNEIINDKSSFITRVMESTNSNSNFTKYKNEVKKLNNRLDSINKVMKKLYEDYALDKTTEVLYNNLKITYEVEMNEIVDKISEINNEILDYKQQENKLIEFIKVVSNYNKIEELDIKILNDFTIFNKIVDITINV